MANGKLSLTRAQLAAFLKDHQAIRQFELLFTTVDEIAPDLVNEINIAAENAGARAQQALDLLQQVAHALELLALAPRLAEVPVDQVDPPSRADELHERIRSLPALLTQVAAPAASGFSVTVVALANGKIYNVWLLLKPTAGFAAGTIVLPAVTSCTDQQEVSVSCTQQVVALTVDGNGATVTGEPSSLAADATFKLRYNLASTTWHRAE